VTALEEVLIRTVAEYGITATRIDGKRGIWVGNNKIAAIGVRIARWVTCHGWALNVSTDLEHFRLITPCGLAGTGVTSIERETGREIDRQEVRDALARHFSEVFERELVPRPETIPLVKVLVHDGTRVLLLHRRPERGNFWQPITGSIETGETPLQTAERELREETGNAGVPISMALNQSFMIESHFLQAKYPTPIIASEAVFQVRLDSTLPVVIDPLEHDDWGWFTIAHAFDKIRWTDDREALVELRALLAREGDANAPASPPVTGPIMPQPVPAT
jgi:lipoyl(octanoyl) transferase